MNTSDIPENTPEQFAEQQTPIKQWDVIGASIQGISHQKTQKPCQDAHKWEIIAPGILAAAIADGAGSATLSEIGANVASNTAIGNIRNVYPRFSAENKNDDDEAWKQLLTESLQAALTAVEEEAEKQNVPPRELATTLILIVATDQMIAIAQVGDGAAVINDSEGNITALTTPQSGEFINETTFIVSPDALSKAEFKVWRGKANQIAMFSDGLQMLALNLPAGNPHAPFFAPLFQFVADLKNHTDTQEQLEAFLRSPRISERTDDDLTLLLANLG